MFGLYGLPDPEQGFQQLARHSQLAIRSEADAEGAALLFYKMVRIIIGYLHPKIKPFPAPAQGPHRSRWEPLSGVLGVIYQVLWAHLDRENTSTGFGRRVFRRR